MSSQTFTFPGFTQQTFTVPPAVTSVFIEVVGGQGGDGGGSGSASGGPGGHGADVGVQVGVEPGQVFDLHVGKQGVDGMDNGGERGIGDWVNDNQAAGGDGGYADSYSTVTASCSVRATSMRTPPRRWPPGRSSERTR